MSLENESDIFIGEQKEIEQGIRLQMGQLTRIPAQSTHLDSDQFSRIYKSGLDPNFLFFLKKGKYLLW